MPEVLIDYAGFDAIDTVTFALDTTSYQGIKYCFSSHLLVC